MAVLLRQRQLATHHRRLRLCWRLARSAQSIISPVPLRHRLAIGGAEGRDVLGELHARGGSVSDDRVLGAEARREAVRIHAHLGEARDEAREGKER